MLLHRPPRPKRVLHLPCPATGEGVARWLTKGVLVAGLLLSWMQPKFPAMRELNTLPNKEVAGRLAKARRTDYPSHLELPGLYEVYPGVLLITERFTDQMPQWVCRRYATYLRWLFGRFLSYLPEEVGASKKNQSDYDQALAATLVWLKSQPGWSEWLAEEDMKYNLPYLMQTFSDASEAYPLTQAFFTGLKPRAKVQP